MDYETNPMGCDHIPQFGWEIKSDRRNVIQQAYELQIAEDESFSNLVYDSGWVESSASAHQFVENISIKSAWKYYVRVRISDALEKSAWSETAYFVTALLTKEEWCAPFVSAETDESYKSCSKGTYVRGTFQIKKKLKAAYAYTTALGLYNFLLNREKVGKDELPYFFSV